MLIANVCVKISKQSGESLEIGISFPLHCWVGWPMPENIGNGKNVTSGVLFEMGNCFRKYSFCDLMV